MSGPSAPSAFDFKRFGVGQPVPRTEDPVLLRGEGRFTDDLAAEGQARLVAVRSQVAHGTLASVDVEAAREMPGVLGVWTGADFEAAGYQWNNSWLTLPQKDGSHSLQTRRMILATDRVRYVGEPVAFVVAETLAQAQDAAEVVAVEIDPLPVLLDPRKAMEPDAPQLHDDIPQNCVLDFFHGDEARTEAAFAKAAHVARVSLVDNRIVINPMELRSYLAEYDAGRNHFTLRTSSQGVYSLRGEIATIMGLDTENLTILTGHVGGSFGMRILPFAEQIGCLYAARELGRPVKFLEERSPSFLSDNHSRATTYDAELAIDAEGHFLGLRIRGFGDLGAYMTGSGIIMPTRSIVLNAPSQYRLPCLEVSMKCVVTNTTPVGALRGAGRQAANYITERLIDEAAVLSGIDRIELRRINQIRPDEFPFKAQSGLTYDVGDFTALMEDAMARADVDGFPARREASRKGGKLRGLGIGCFLEASSLATAEMGRVTFEENGDVTFTTGTLDYGQGHATTFAQILGQKLGVPFEKIRLVQGNSDKLIFGGGTGGSRSTISSGTAAVEVGDKVIEKALQLASWALDTNANDIDFKDGRVTVVSTGEGIGLIELARKVREASDLPAGLPRSLDAELVTEGPGVTFPNGCHIAEVEIDEDTGVTRVVRYTMVNDIGVVVNPLLLEAQSHGGVMQGIGQCLLEDMIYDEEGQVLTGSFTDYCMPRADDAPFFDVGHHPVPTKNNPLGVKGVGESGCAGSITSVMNAVVDALSMVGVRHIDMPATPQKVWRILQDAKRRAA